MNIIEDLENKVLIEAQTIEINEKEGVMDGVVPNEATTNQVTLSVADIEQLHQDLVMTNTLLAVLIGGFAVYCFFRFLFKG